MTPKVETWLALAQDDLDFAEEVLGNKKRPHYAAHLCHQAMEKLLKAIVQSKGEPPQYTHNLKILCQQANLHLSEKKMQWLLALGTHYLGAGYPEDIFKLQKQYTQQFSEQLFRETKEFFQWLKSNYLK